MARRRHRRTMAPVPPVPPALTETFHGGPGASRRSSFVPPSPPRLRAEGLMRVCWSFFMALTICLLPVLLAANTVLAGIWGVVLPVTGTATAFLMLQIELAGESARTDPDARRAARLVIEGRLAVVLGMFLLFTVTLRAGFTPDFVCRDFLWVLAVLAFRDFFRLRRWAALVEVVFLIATVAVVQMLRGNATIAAAGFGAGLSTFARGMIESLQGLAAESKQSRTPGFV